MRGADAGGPADGEQPRQGEVPALRHDGPLAYDAREDRGRQARAAGERTRGPEASVAREELGLCSVETAGDRWTVWCPTARYGAVYRGLWGGGGLKTAVTGVGEK